jgi:hypothetical protein
MKLRRRIGVDDQGAAVVEMAFALPVFIVMVWMVAQLGMVYEAVAGMQQGLGEGARYATLCLSPGTGTGCTVPTGAQVRLKVLDTVYGTGLGHFDVPTPTLSAVGTSSYYDLTVTYTQDINMILFPGPTITLTRSKRVWVASN